MEELWKPGPREKREKGKNGKTEGWKREKNGRILDIYICWKVCQSVSMSNCQSLSLSDFPFFQFSLTCRVPHIFCSSVLPFFLTVGFLPKKLASKREYVYLYWLPNT